MSKQTLKNAAMNSRQALQYISKTSNIVAQIFQLNEVKYEVTNKVVCFMYCLIRKLFNAAICLIKHKFN